VLGVLDIQSKQLNRFSAEIQTLMQSIANQTATAIDNARLLANTQTALQKVERLNRQLLRETWDDFSKDTKAQGYHFSKGKSQVLTTETNVWLPPMRKAAVEKRLVKETHVGNGEGTQAELAIPLILRNEVIGVLGVKRENMSEWADEEVSAVEVIANQVALALENARLSEEQIKTIEKLQEVDRLKSEFLTSMSHELRTPLNSIIGFADVIIQGIDGEVSDLAFNDVNLIYNSGQHLLALINDILDINKIEAGMLELVPEPLDVRTVVGDVLAATSSLLKDKPVELIVNIANDLPEVHADKLRLNQILLNLVSNAIKFTKKGEIVIEAEVFEDNPHQMFICVIDEGIGIPKDKFGTIFNRFSQADSSTTREYGGTGLGLPICKQLAEMHGGTIGVESEVGVGSKFFFTIPLADFVVSEESSQ
jgi:signal transduction histidine kinase